MTIRLTAAEATEEQGLAFARFIEAATGGSFALMLGSSFASILATAYRVPGHDLSFESVMFAVDIAVDIDRDEAAGEEAIVGMVSAFSSERHRRSSTKPLTDAAGWRSLRMGAFVAAGYPMFRFLEQIPDGDQYIQALAVEPDQRRHGIGSTLLDHTGQTARDDGFERLSLHVDVKNDGAIRLYERHGLAIEATSGKAWLIGGEQVHRMAKRLP